MRQLNLPQKQTTIARVWISFALILLSVVFAFMPLLQINLQSEQAKTSVGNALNGFDEEFNMGELNAEVPEKIDVSAVKVFRTVGILGNFIEAIITSATSDTADAPNAALQRLEKKLDTPEGRDAIVTMLALAAQAVDVEDLLGTNDPWEPTVENYSEEDMEKALGELYEKGAFEYKAYTLNTYLEGQYKLFRADKSAYLKSIGCAGKSYDKFEDIPAKNVFAHMRTMICAYIESELSYNEDAPSRITNYDKIPDYIEEYMDWGAENIYESALYGISGYIDYNMADLLKQHMNSYVVDMVFGNQATRMLAVMMNEDVISTAEYWDLMEELEEDGYRLRDINLETLFGYLDFSEKEMDEAFKALYEADAYYTVTGVDKADADKVDSETIGAIKTVVGLGMVFYIVVYITVWPIVLFIYALITLKRAISAMKNPAAVGKVAGSVFMPLGFTVSTLLLLTFFPDITWGWAMTTIFVLSLVGVVLNLVASRLRAYNLPDFKYATVVQGTAALSAVGLTVYTLSVIKTGFLRNFLDTLVSYLAKITSQLVVYNQEVKFYQQFFNQNRMYTASASSAYWLDLLLLLAAALIAFFVICALVKTFAARLGLVKYKPSGAAFSIVAPIFALISCVLPIVASKMENYVTFERTAKGVKAVANGSLFVIGDSQNALIGMFVGAGLMLVAVIAFLILRKVLCSDTSAADAKLVLLGNAPALASAEDASAEAPAEENAEASAEASTEENADAPAEENAEASTEENADAPAEAAPATTDASSIGFAILGFFIPVVGLVLYLVNKNTYPKKAKSAGKGALIGFIVNIVISVIYGVILGSMLGNMMY